MLVVETVVRIRREHASGKAIKAIARDLRVSRKVVRVHGGDKPGHWIVGDVLMRAVVARRLR
jgi:hypothetical protein